MSSRFDRECPVPFDSVSGTTRGIIRKAGLQSTALTESGLGVGSTNGMGAAAEFVNGGLRKIGALGIGASVSIPLTAAQQKTMPNVGAIQFDIYKEDFLARSSNLAGAARCLIDLTDGVTAKQLVLIDWAAQGSTAGNYRQFTDGWDGSAVWTRAAVLRSSSAWAVSENPQHVIHEGTETDDDGYVTVTVGWDGLFFYWYINGLLVSQFRRKYIGLTPTQVRLFPDTWQVAGAECCPAIRNVLILSSPPPHPNAAPGAYRVQLLTHSYGNKGNAQVQWDPAAANYWSGDIGGYTCASVDSVVSAIRKNSRNDLALINTAKSGQSTSWMVQQVTSHASADGRFFPASNNSVTPRFRPHIVVLCGHMNEGADTAPIASGAASNLHSVNAALVSIGIVPVWVLESNADITGTAAYNHSANVVPSMKAQIAADISTYGDIGYVNVYDATGGATVGGSYMEHTATPSTAVHHNYKGQKLMGEMIAEEIDRLIRTPPAYAWWA
jgi:hypothetical protein